MIESSGSTSETTTELNVVLNWYSELERLVGERSAARSPTTRSLRRSIVYKTLALNLNREIALKVLPLELISDPDRKRRFVQEAQAAAALKHPNIGVIYEIDEVDGVDFIAMELIQGEKLSDVLRRETLPLEPRGS